VTLERPIGEVAGDVGLVIDIRLSLAEKREELATESECRVAHLVVLRRNEAETHGEVFPVVIGGDPQRQRCLESFEPVTDGEVVVECPERPGASTAASRAKARIPAP